MTRTRHRRISWRWLAAIAILVLHVAVLVEARGKELRTQGRVSLMMAIIHLLAFDMILAGGYGMLISIREQTAIRPLSGSTLATYLLTWAFCFAVILSGVVWILIA